VASNRTNGRLGIEKRERDKDETRDDGCLHVDYVWLAAAVEEASDEMRPARLVTDRPTDRHGSLVDRRVLGSAAGRVAAAAAVVRPTAVTA